MDREQVLPVGFILLAASGALCSALAAIHYLRSGESEDTPRLSGAMVAFALQYFLFPTVTTLGNYLLLPTILLFFTLVALIIVIWLGIQAHSRAGFRIALAAFFTLAAYVCKIGSESQELPKVYWP